MCSSAEPPSDVLTDVSDGQIFKSNDFFVQNPSSLKLVLYQDAFEVVNPLGSAKTRHKVLAVYLYTQTTCHLFYCAERKISKDLSMLNCSLIY